MKFILFYFLGLKCLTHAICLLLQIPRDFGRFFLSFKDAAVQRYRENLGKKLTGTRLVVVNQAYYPLCCGSSCSFIDKKEKKILSTLWS